MSLELMARCNQKLGFAKQLIASLPDNDDGINTAGATIEGVIHHLALSIRFYLCEVASWYGATPKSLLTDVDDLLAHIPSEMHSSPVIDQLCAVHHSNFSWLSMIRFARNEILSVEKPPMKNHPAAQIAEQLISTVQIEDKNWRNRTTLEQLVMETENFFEQQRLLMKEF